LVDKYAHQKRRAPEFELHDFFGQILRIFIVDIPSSPEADIEEETVIYAAIHPANVIQSSPGRPGVHYYKDMKPVEIVDLELVQCVVGRIRD
jgi:hypothetical protein